MGGTRAARVVVVALFLASALVAPGLAGPAAVTAADGMEHSAAVTYLVNVDAGRLDVTNVLTVKNTAGSAYYLAGAYVVLEGDAANVRVQPSSGTASIALSQRFSDGYSVWLIRFSNLNYNQSRTFTVTYQLPGGAPRSDAVTRVGKAFASFCVIGNGMDTGTVSVVAPSSFSWNMVMSGGVLVPSTADGTTTWTSNPLANPLSFWACMAGTNPAGYQVTSFTSPGGRAVRVEAWPEDPSWTEQIGPQVTAAITGLEKLMGRGLPAGSAPIVIREVTASALSNYAATFDDKTFTALVSEDIEPGVVAHELSHAWFNGGLFDARWLNEGAAMWAEGVITGDPCKNDPGAAPSSTQKLSSWLLPGPRATDAELAAVAYQYRAACFVVTTLATRVGENRMRDVLTALIDRRIPYAGASTTLSNHKAPEDWRGFLDAVDEAGLIPAGETDFDYAQNLLLRFGATSDTSSLTARSQARSRYHAELAKMSGWTMPDSLVRAMSDWSFSTASAAMDAGDTVWTTVSQTTTTLAASEAGSGPARKAFETASSTADYDKAVALAKDQLAAAELVAAAQARIAAPRADVESLGLTGRDLAPTYAEAVAAVVAADLPTAQAKVSLIDESLVAEATAAATVAAAKARVDADRDLLVAIGLLGADLSSPITDGKAAVTAGDVAAAQAAAARVDAIMGDASQQGIIRIAVTTGVLVLVAVAVVVIRRRRATARIPLGVAVEAPAVAATADETLPTEAPAPEASTPVMAVVPLPEGDGAAPAAEPAGQAAESPGEPPAEPLPEKDRRRFGGPRPGPLGPTPMPG